MPGSFRIGNIAGIDIHINISWIVAVVLLTVSLSLNWFPSFYPGMGVVTYLLLGFIATLLLFFSVLLHEMAHSLVARRRGLPVKNIVLFIFGGVSNIEQEAKSPGVEFQIAFVGPLVSLLIGGLAYLLLLPFNGRPSPVVAVLAYLSAANILLGIFNLVPGFPLDGGRVLRSIVWKITGNANTATQVATVVGQVIAYLFILTGIWLFFEGSTLSGIWLGFIGWFLLNAAQSVRTQTALETTFKGIKVAQIMNANPVTVPANISLQNLVENYFLPQGLRAAPVMQGDQWVGLITLTDIRHVKQEERAQTPVGVAMVPVERLYVAAPQQSLSEVLPLMSSHDINQLPVAQDGRLLGMLSRDAIIRMLEIRHRLGLDRAA